MIPKAYYWDDSSSWGEPEQAAKPQDGSFYGTAGSSRILVQNVGCIGSEATLLNCSNDSSIPCSHDNEVAVFCQVNCEF